MECTVCSRRFGKSRQATCASCARAELYIPRIEQISLLLDKEKLQKKVQTVLKPHSQLGSSEFSTASQFVELTEAARKLEVQDQRNQIRSIESRIATVKEQQRRLRTQITEARKDAGLRKEDHRSSSSSLQQARQKLATEGAQQLEAALSSCKRVAQRTDKYQKRLLDGRRELCTGSAVLFGLSKHHGRKHEGKERSEWYSIGKVPIPDLREMHVMHPENINASLAHLSRLLVITSHYLGVRLPAEIIAPHAGNTRPLVLSLQSSYKSSGAPPRKPRYLHLTKPLPLLAKEDTPTYNLFIDGVVLLAYDIAWLCRTQGVRDVNDWESLCAIGRNSYSLFLSKPEARVDPPAGSDKSQDKSNAVPSATAPRFGEFSHAGSTTNISSHLMTERLATWELPSLPRVEDKLKAHLLTEMAGAEWELLDEKEWEEEREDERAVLVGGARWSLNSGESKLGVSRSAALGVDETSQGAAEAKNAGDEKDDSGRGWMKLKVRSGES